MVLEGGELATVGSMRNIGVGCRTLSLLSARCAGEEGGDELSKP